MEPRQVASPSPEHGPNSASSLEPIQPIGLKALKVLEFQQGLFSITVDLAASWGLYRVTRSPVVDLADFVAVECSTFFLSCTEPKDLDNFRDVFQGGSRFDK